MRRLRTMAALLAISMIALTGPVGAASGGRHVTDGSTAPVATVDTSYALVQLKGEPLSTYAKTKPAQGKKIDFNSATVKSYKATLAALRNSFKSWLQKTAPKAQVVKGYDLSLNAVAVKLNGTSLATIRTSTLVARAEYEGLYYPTVEAADPDLGLISALDAWAAYGATPADAGTGVKVGVIDTGIDKTHPCFADGEYPIITHYGQTQYTNNKVFVARVFNNKLPQNGLDAKAVQEHGTHVAGTIACNYDTAATVDGVAIPYGISGVAPHALLGSYNIFPGNVLNARSEDIINALEAAYADDMSVVNMSLGGGAHGVQDLLTVAVDNLDQANMISAVAAGNSGPGHYTVESPGSAARALTAGASTVPHFIGAPLTVDGTTYGAASGDFATVTTDLTADLAVLPGDTIPGNPSTTSPIGRACNASSPGLPSLTGKIALISRGSCTFSEKIRNAQNAGASAVLVANNVAGDPVAMASDGTANQPTVPAYMVALSTGQALVGSGGALATIGAAESYLSTANGDIMAGFSSQGPTDVDFRVKPDVVAPGVNVLSSIPASASCASPCFAFYQGTSMATPHLAGAAAIVRQAHPDWLAWQVRSAIVNTADTGVLTDYRDGTTLATDVNVSGAGRLNLESAVNATAVLDPVSVSFGATPSGSGVTKTFAVKVTNIGGAAASFSIGSTSGSGVTFSVGSATVAAHSSGTVTVTMTVAKGAAVGDHQAWLTVSSGGSEVAHAAVYAFVK